MPNRSPGSDWPEFVFAAHPRSQLPRTEFAPDLGKSSDDFAHGRALHGVIFDHIGHERFHELETFVFLGLSVSTVRFGGKKKSLDLHKVFSNQVSQIVYISGKWVTTLRHILVLWGGLVATTIRFVEWWAIGRIIPTRQAKVDKEVLRRTSCSCITCSPSKEVPTAVDLGGVKGFRIHI
jgi:hypothetical protein